MPSTKPWPDAALMLPRDRPDMQRLSDWIDDRLKVLGLSGAPAYAVRLCVEEAVLNIVTYSVPQSGLAPDIAVVLDRTGCSLTVDIVGHRPAFDPLSATSPLGTGSLSVGNPQDAPIGGFGIPLMRRYAGAMSCRREAASNYLSVQFEDRATRP